MAYARTLEQFVADHQPIKPDAIAYRESDVYRFRFTAEEYAKRFMPYHCFDGLLLYRSGQFIDSYWGLNWNGGDARVMTATEAERQGSLMFICNLSEVAEIQHYEAPFYDATDCFDLTHHAGYHKRFVIRRGAERSQKAMRAWAERELKAAIDHADAANRNIDWKRERLAQINAGNLR